MSHTYAQNVVHVVFSAKDRRQTINNGLRPRLWAYMAGICKKLGVGLHGVGGTQDHIHLLIQVPPVLALAKCVATIKANSSRWAKEGGHKVIWQQGYGAFSVSASVAPTVARYIEKQEDHHKRMSFDEEFLALLKKHGVEFDPKYVLVRRYAWRRTTQRVQGHGRRGDSPCSGEALRSNHQAIPQMR